ncbi:MAG: hypothetical protein BGN86_00245 [Caulobacterales bacterium 68-7]|nr:MAG: hypothetical protein BGN86_00245 [Caulobacterales bacterium 68-7]
MSDPFEGRRIGALMGGGGHAETKTVLLRLRTENGQEIDLPFSAGVSTTVAVALITEAGRLGPSDSAQALKAVSGQAALNNAGDVALAVKLASGAELFLALDPDQAGMVGANLVRLAALAKSGPTARQ